MDTMSCYVGGGMFLENYFKPAVLNRCRKRNRYHWNFKNLFFGDLKGDC